MSDLDPTAFARSKGPINVLGAVPGKDLVIAVHDQAGAADGEVPRTGSDILPESVLLSTGATVSTSLG